MHGRKTLTIRFVRNGFKMNPLLRKTGTITAICFAFEMYNADDLLAVRYELRKSILWSFGCLCMHIRGWYDGIYTNMCVVIHFSCPKAQLCYSFRLTIDNSHIARLTSQRFLISSDIYHSKKHNIFQNSRWLMSTSKENYIDYVRILSHFELFVKFFVISPHFPDGCLVKWKKR